MAFWIEDRYTVVDPGRPGGKGEIIKYGCDTSADILLLKGQNGDPKTRGSSCLVNTPAELWKLGTNGWIKVE